MVPLRIDVAGLGDVASDVVGVADMAEDGDLLRGYRDPASLENGVGWLYAHLGQYDQALTHCQRALGLHGESGHRGGAADTLDSLGFVYLKLGDTVQAKLHYTRAVDRCPGGLPRPCPGS
jgi:tetratricopeptide (TPR) repeat protein